LDGEGLETDAKRNEVGVAHRCESYGTCADTLPRRGAPRQSFTLQKTVVACVLTSTSKETRTFGTMTHELLEFVAWLEQERVTHVALESTGAIGSPSSIFLKGGTSNS
jgi:hypothetical protein